MTESAETAGGVGAVGATTAEGVAAASHVPAGERLDRRTIFAYGLPGVGAGYMYLLLGLYVMKFSTDVLLIAPAIMGTIFGVSRIWDAISDPLAGYYSDRTRSKLGRRRSWILISIVPMAATFIMTFSPPTFLEGGALVAWMAVGIIGFYSALTVFVVPHMALGAELTSNYHERSRLFGIRHATWTLGSILSLVSMQLLINAEQVSSAESRRVAVDLAVIASGLTAILLVYAVATLKERHDFQGRAAKTPFSAFHDVWKNHHARLLIVVTFIEHIGSAAIGVLTLYVAQYVMLRPALGPLLILSYMIPSSASVPLWLPLSRRFGKIRLWRFAMVLTGTSFGGFFSLPFLTGTGFEVPAAFFFAFFAGIAAGCGGTVGPSVQGDIIDYDEYLTGERKEGAYFAAWNFVYKSGGGVIVLLTGYVLQLAGFVPNVEQTMTVKLAIVALYGLFPLATYTIGAYLFGRFTLDEKAHTEIRHALDQRRAEAAGLTPP